MRKRILSLALPAALAFGIAGTAHSSIIFDNWTLDLTGLGIEEAFSTDPVVISNIQQVAYFGVSHAQVLVDNGPAGVSVGDYSVTDGHLAATNLINSSSQIISPASSFLNFTWEMTFDFTTATYNYAADGLDINFAHLGPVPSLGVDGYLDIYIEDLKGGGGTIATGSTGDGYTEGTLVARLENIPGNGGVFTPATFDGSDDATFALNPDDAGDGSDGKTFILQGVFFADVDNDGVLEDLANVDPTYVALAITDNNFDGDPAEAGKFSVLEPSNWNLYFPTRLAGGEDTDLVPDGLADNSTGSGFYALEDGSARLGANIVPEPGTMILLGSGLLGIAGIGRKRLHRRS